MDKRVIGRVSDERVRPKLGIRLGVVDSAAGVVSAN